MLLTKLTDSSLFSDAYNIAGTGLDSTLARPTDSHLPVLAQKSARQHAHNTKTVIVVDIIARVIVVAVGGTAIIRIIVERTATFSLPAPSLFYFRFWILDFGFVLLINRTYANGKSQHYL